VHEEEEEEEEEWLKRHAQDAVEREFNRRAFSSETSSPHLPWYDHVEQFKK
jgi:hypothetical protein